MSPASGTLLLVPTLLGATAPDQVLPEATLRVTRATSIFLAESAKSARAFLKAIGHPQPIAHLAVFEIGHRPDHRLIDSWLAPLLDGHDVALLSEAGCPAIADPGADIVARAHQHGLHVRPLVGPSSLLLALMASGMSGQRFRFVGYLPQDRQALAAAIGELERASRGEETQLFIETPYRNERLLQALMEHCRAETTLAVAVDLTTDDERVLSLPISKWRALPPQALPPLTRRPAVFALTAAPAVQPSTRRSERGRTPGSGRQ
jgi:16S rRNA (cytidine1402-2'-O)-methyltransferase